MVVILPGAAAGYYFGYNVGTLAVLITDESVRDFASLNVTFVQVQVHSTAALTPFAWVTVDLASTTVDLMRLSNNAIATLGLDRVPAGEYSEVRIVVDSAEGELKSGGTVAVRVPSGELKVYAPFELKPLGSVTLLVRLQVVGASGDYLMRPLFGGVMADT